MAAKLPPASRFPRRDPQPRAKMMGRGSYIAMDSENQCRFCWPGRFNHYPILKKEYSQCCSTNLASSLWILIAGEATLLYSGPAEGSAGYTQQWLRGSLYSLKRLRIQVSDYSVWRRREKWSLVSSAQGRQTSPKPAAWPAPSAGFGETEELDFRPYLLSYKPKKSWEFWPYPAERDQSVMQGWFLAPPTRFGGTRVLMSYAELEFLDCVSRGGFFLITRWSNVMLCSYTARRQIWAPLRVQPALSWKGKRLPFYRLWALSPMEDCLDKPCQVSWTSARHSYMGKNESGPKCETSISSIWDEDKVLRLLLQAESA